MRDKIKKNLWAKTVKVVMDANQSNPCVIRDELAMMQEFYEEKEELTGDEWKLYSAVKGGKKKGYGDV